MTHILLPEINAMHDELNDTIEQNAKWPAKASGDAGSVEQHPLTDQIEAAKFLASKDPYSFEPHMLAERKLLSRGSIR